MEDDLILEHPRSPEHQDAFLHSYMSLEEPRKVAVLRHLGKNGGEMLQFLIRSAGLPRGATAPKVTQRSGSYGEIIDRWLTSPENAKFLNHTCFLYLADCGYVGALTTFARSLPDEPTMLQAVQLFIEENIDDPFAALAGKWAAAYMNFSGSEFRDLTNFSTEDTRDDAPDEEESSIDSQDNIADPAQKSESDEGDVTALDSRPEVTPSAEAVMTNVGQTEQSSELSSPISEAEALQLARRIASGMRSTFTGKSCASVLAKVDHELGVVRDDIETFQTLKHQISDNKNALAQVSWLKEIVSGLEPGLASNQAGLLPLVDGISLLRNECAELEQISALHTKLDALRERLGPYADDKPVDIAVASLSELQTALESVVEKWETEGSEIDQSTQVYLQLLDVVRTAVPPDAISLAEGLSFEDWLKCLRVLLLVGKVPGLSEKLELKHVDWQLAGLMLRVLFSRNTEAARSFVKHHLPSAIDHGDGKLEYLCAYLDFEEMKWAASCSRPLALIVASVFLAELLGAGRNEITSFINDLCVDSAETLDPACLAFLREFSAELKSHGAERAKEALAAAFRQGSTSSEPEQSGDLQEQVLALIRDAPGMKGHYHRLRASAQVLFLKPLEQLVAGADAKRALQQWQEGGSLEEMADTAARASGRASEVEERHLEQTRRYLRTFDRALKAWALRSVPEHRPPNHRFEQAIEHLEQAARSGNRSAESLLVVVREPAKAYENLPKAYGERARGTLLQGDASSFSDYVDPLLTCTWPDFVSSAEATVVAAIVDRMRASVGLQPTDLSSAVDLYLKEADYQSAMKAASVAGRKDLEARIQEHFGKQVTSLAEKHSADLAAAKDLKSNVPELAYALDQIDLAQKSMQLQDVREAYELLADGVKNKRADDSPERNALVEFLRQAGRECPSSANVSELRELAGAIRIERNGERQHIVALEELVLDDRTGVRVAGKFETLAAVLDRPSLWLPAEKSLQLAKCLDPISKWIKGKSRGAAFESPDAFMAKQAVDWLEQQLDPRNGFGPDADISPLVTVSSLMDEYAPDGDVLKALQNSLESGPDTFVADQSNAEVPSLPPPTAQPVASRPGKFDAGELKLLGKLLAPFAEEAPWEVRSVREAANKGEWTSVLRGACSILSHKNYESSVLHDMEAVAVVALLKVRNREVDLALTDDDYIEMIAALMRSARANFNAGSQQNVDAALRNALALGLGQSEHETSSQQLADILGSLFGNPEADSQTQWFQRLLYRSAEVADAKQSPLLARLSRKIWDQLANTTDTERNSARAFLIARLFGGGHRDELMTLAETSPAADLIKICIQAFAAAEADPASRAAALQQSAVFRDRSRGKSNVQPWLIFMHTLEAARFEANKESLQIELVSPFPTQLDGIGWCLEVLVRPSLFNPPKHLSVRINQEAPVQLFAEPIFSERTIQLPISEKLVSETSAPAQVSYSFPGETLTGESFDLKGSWEIQPSQRSAALPEHLITAAWPGASGHPVSVNHGFYGRERQLEQIQSFLRAPDRMKSVMVFGERRIGKTSLLLELCGELPPGEGRAAGVFCDMQGVSFRTDLSIPRTFFNRVVLDLDREQNAEIKKCLAANGCTTEVQKMARRVDPDVSLSAALESLVNKLAENSGGKLSRLVFIIDEFDRFVEPLFGDRKKEVDSFMWELRQIIQRSSRIAFVLAGSGLQRIFKENYQDALFGSIDEVEIPRFRWDDEKDRAAITNVVLPKVVRDQVCAKEEVSNVAKRAAELCDGHPMFLATLGCAAAKLAGGRLFTPALLRWTVGEITKGRAAIPSGQDRTLFYAHQLEALNRLDSRRRLFAVSLAAQIARLTTPEYPWVPNTRIFEQCGLREFAKEQELLAGLRDLETASVISREMGKGMSRIRVPITAECLREDASEQIEECRSKLRDLT